MGNQKYDQMSKLVAALVERDGFDAAINYLSNGLKKAPNLLEAYLVRGELYMEMGAFQKALSDYEKAIELNPNEPESYFLRGSLYARPGKDIDIDKAITDFNKTIELEANHVGAYANRANMYLKKREPQKVISDCTKAIELSPNSAEPYYNRGLAYANTGELTAALDDYNTVIKLTPKGAPMYIEALFKRGLLRSQSGDTQWAIIDYEEFLALDPNNHNAEMVRGVLDELRSSDSDGSMPNNTIDEAKSVPFSVYASPDTVVDGIPPTKNKWVLLLLCFFLGWFGVHRLYQGKIVTGVLYMFTGGLFCIGWAYDLWLLLITPNKPITESHQYGIYLNILKILRESGYTIKESERDWCMVSSKIALDSAYCGYVMVFADPRPGLLSFIIGCFFPPYEYHRYGETAYGMWKRILEKIRYQYERDGYNFRQYHYWPRDSFVAGVAVTTDGPYNNKWLSVLESVIG